MGIQGSGVWGPGLGLGKMGMKRRETRGCAQGVRVRETVKRRPLCTAVWKRREADQGKRGSGR